MEISVLQMVITITVIVGAAGVAILCDFLKSKNEQLREEMAEIRARQQTEVAREVTAEIVAPEPPRKPVATAVATEIIPVATLQSAKQVTPRVASAAFERAAAAAAERAKAPKPVRGGGRRPRPDADGTDAFVRKSAPKAAPQVQMQMTPAEIASVTGFKAARVKEAESAVHEPEPIVNKTVAPKDSLSDWLARRAAARAARKEKPIDNFIFEAVASDKPVVEETRLQLVRSASESSTNLLVPAGMFDESFLSRLLDIHKPFTGLAVSIGVSDNDGRSPANLDMVKAAGSFIASLLGEKDFACQLGVDEFLMICPDQTGADAHRRLGQISERLWDFQLRGIGTFPFLFSWGGADVQGESLAEVIAAATERMYQTKRGRKTVSMNSADRRKVV